MATLNAGSGADGNAVASSNTNLNTGSLIGRGYGDMVSYNCSAVGSNSCTVTETPNGLAVGDEVLLMNIRGVGYNGGTYVVNEGNYETFEISDISSNVITFTTSKTKYYGDGASDDTNIGTDTANNQKVILQRVPNYNNLTINNGVTINADTYGGPKGGVLFLRVKDTLTVSGSVNMDYKGPRGGTPKVLGGGGPYVNPDGGIGHPSAGYFGDSGTGASHATQGVEGGSTPAPTYGGQELTKLYMGSGGASAGTGSRGGYGGGIIAMFAGTMHVYGNVTANGYASQDNYPYKDPGGGSGGSVLLQAGTLWMHSSTTDAYGETGPGTGGTGGDGRIAIYYSALGDSVTGATPTPYEDNQLELPYNISGTTNENCTVRIYDSSWTFVKSESVSSGAYQVTNLPNEGPFYVIAEADTAGKNLISYKSIVPSN